MIKVFKKRKGSKNSFFDMNNRVFIKLNDLKNTVSKGDKVLIIDDKGYDITKEVLNEAS